MMRNHTLGQLRRGETDAIRNPQSAARLSSTLRLGSTELAEVRPEGNSPKSIRNSGFTLVELLVSVSIMAILATLTFTAYNRSADGDRVPSAARQLQSYLEGARDRAIHAKDSRGVRFLVDHDTNTVSSMVFVGASEIYKVGQIQIVDDTDDWTIDFGVSVPPNWDNLVNRGLFNRNGARIKLENGYYTVAALGTAPGPYSYRLTRTYPGTKSTLLSYELQLEPAVLANQEPRMLARGVVIDLTHSKPFLPMSWCPSGVWSDRMDVMFSPRGTVIGDAASSGLLHFLIADADDVEAGRYPGKDDKRGEERIVTLTPHTGSISTYQVVPTSPYDEDEAFSLAKKGAVAK